MAPVSRIPCTTVRSSASTADSVPAREGRRAPGSAHPSGPDPVDVRVIRIRAAAAAGPFRRPGAHTGTIRPPRGAGTR
ncbi:hypothetical protein GCM10010267_02360 [Streptomyces griseorubens]|nr:hypothetical protein GCM10010267_02360 [Streptomyces griseorubens]